MAILLGFALFFVPGIYCILFIIQKKNEFIASRNKVDQAYSDFITELQRRFSLVVRLSKWVESYAKHEKDLFREFSEARKEFSASIKILGQKSSDAIGNILALAEHHPELKASETYMKIMSEIDKVETHILKSKQDFNRIATGYNSEIQTFPASIISSAFVFPIASMITNIDISFAQDESFLNGQNRMTHQKII